MASTCARTGDIDPSRVRPGGRTRAQSRACRIVYASSGTTRPPRPGCQLGQRPAAAAHLQPWPLYLRTQPAARRHWRSSAGGSSWESGGWPSARLTSSTSASRLDLAFHPAIDAELKRSLQRDAAVLVGPDLGVIWRSGSPGASRSRWSNLTARRARCAKRLEVSAARIPHTNDEVGDLARAFARWRRV